MTNITTIIRLNCNSVLIKTDTTCDYHNIENHEYKKHETAIQRFFEIRETMLAHGFELITEDVNTSDNYKIVEFRKRLKY